MIFVKLGESRLNVNNKELSMVEECKYLGVILNSITKSNSDILKNMWPYTAENASKASFAI